MTLGNVAAQHVAFPLAHIHLAQPVLDMRVDAEPRGEWRRGLRSALQRCDIDRSNPGVAETFRNGCGVSVALWCQLRIGVAAHEWETDPVHSGGRLAVPDQQQGRCRITAST